MVAFGIAEPVHMNALVLLPEMIGTLAVAAAGVITWQHDAVPVPLSSIPGRIGSNETLIVATLSEAIAVHGFPRLEQPYGPPHLLDRLCISRTDRPWTRLQLLDDRRFGWRQWIPDGLVFWAEDSCATPVEELADPPENTANYVARVLEHLASSLRLPTPQRTDAMRYGIRGVATPYPHTDWRITPYVDPIWRTSPVDWDSLEAAMMVQRLEELASRIDSLIDAHRRDTTLAMP